ncbi:hypothetical protein FRB90_002435, partial [Tulasnella sp. 427]
GLQYTQTIPASPAPAIIEEEGEISPLEADTITALHITRGAIPSFQPRTLTRNATVSHWSPGVRVDDMAPQRMIQHRRRAASEHWINSFQVQESQPRLSNETALSIVNAATSELGDLIHHLDLAATPEATLVKAATPRRPRAFTTGDSPDAALRTNAGHGVGVRQRAATLRRSSRSSCQWRRSARSSRRSEGGSSDLRPPTTRPPQIASLRPADRPPLLGPMMMPTLRVAVEESWSEAERCIPAYGSWKDVDRNDAQRVWSSIDASLTAFGQVHGNVSGEADNSGIRRELRDILANRSEDTSLGFAEANLFCDLSIPANASALMSSTHIESLICPSSQTSHHKSSTPPTSVPAMTLPAQPKLSSDSALTVFDLVVEEVKKTATNAVPSAEKTASQDLLGASGEDITDHTGRSPFDFTKELNRLNEGGSRRTDAPLPSLDFLRQIHDNGEDEIEVQNQQSTSDDQPLAVNPDSTMYAVANIDLSLLLSSPEPKKPSPPKSTGPQTRPPKQTTPHSTSIESDVSKRHTRIAQARAYRRFKNLRERPLSTATTASFGSVVKQDASDPFNYDFSRDESSAEGIERRQNHTMTSIPSISSCGAVLRSGVKNPFGYNVTTNSYDRSAYLDQSVEMPRGANSRYSFVSDRSSFYFDSSKLANRGQGLNDSIMSRSRSSRPLPFRPGPRPDSLMSTSLHAWGYGSQGMQGGRTSWAKDRHDPARDSIISEVSFRHLSRPGLGDKMFESGPLYSIAGSTAQSSMCGEFGHGDNACQQLRSSYGSTDSQSLRFSVNSIFDKSGSNTSSISSPSVFGTTSVCETSQEDDTMISMLGGEHTKVPRPSLGSDVNGSPCVRAEKILRAAGKSRQKETKRGSNLAGLSMSSARSDEEEVSQEVVSRPAREAELSAKLSTSQISQSTSPPTPPLCYASSADGSQSSIDAEKLNALLETSAPPSFNPDRRRPQGKGHRRRSYMSEMSRIPIIESIAEEVTSENGSPRAPKFEPLPDPSVRIWGGPSRRSFDPPRNPAAIKALLEHSKQNFIPLPSEPCVRKPRSRANSQPSPYPRRPAKTISGQPFLRHGRTPSMESALNCISPFSHPVLSSAAYSSISPSLASYAPLSPFSVNFQSVAVPSPEKVQAPVPSLCSMIESDAKRYVLGRRVENPVDNTNISKLNEWSCGGKKSSEKKSSEVLGNKSANKSQSFISSSASAKENKCVKLKEHSQS